MKRFVSFILSAALIFTLAACSDDSEIQDTDSDTEAVSQLAEESDTSETISQSLFLDGADDSDIYYDLSNNDSDSETVESKSTQSIYSYPYDNSTNQSTCNIFRKVVCCGDSYTAGFIADADGVAHKINEDYAWPHYMSILTGSKWYNCGCSGCTVTTWQKHSRGLPAAQALGKSQAYVIGLMINDVSVKNHVELGTIDDIGTENETYYGGMSAIIRKLNAISPEAKIFVNTCPRFDEGYDEYNQAVRDIVAEYKSTYPVHCIDLAENAEMYETETLKNDYWHGHYTAVGYEQFAEIYSVILSRYINEHIDEFQDVAFIEYDE